MIGQRVLPQRNLEPLHTTHKPLLEALAVTVGPSSGLTPVFLRISCNQVLEQE